MEDRVHERVKAVCSVLTSNFTANNVVEYAGAYAIQFGDGTNLE